MRFKHCCGNLTGTNNPDVDLKKNIKASIGSIDLFEREFSCKIATLPRNVMLLGWSAKRKLWFCAPETIIKNPTFNDRFPATLNFLTHQVIPRLSDQTFWTLLCLDDGWRERNTYSKHYHWVHPPNLNQENEWRGAPGEIPVLSENRRWIACYGAHLCDPSALLIPEAHYLSRNYYQELFANVHKCLVPWDKKMTHAIFCAGNHGERTNYFPPIPAERVHPRQYLEQLVETEGLPIHVYLNKKIPKEQQVKYKYILDIDGYARTWDAWAWKMQSGSTVLSANSPWESFFTRFFEEWVHYVPIANDFSDLSDKLEWCVENDAHCRMIAQQAQRRAQEVYSLEYVAQIVAQQLRDKEAITE
jgi:hypothetical protein